MGERAFRHPLRGALNASLLAVLDPYMHSKYAERKRALFQTPPDAKIVELGAGMGANLRYFPRGSHLIAVEPNLAMHRGLQRAASRYGIVLDLHATGAESIDLPDATVDLVVSSLVLCTVPDAAQVAREARRILKPGGRFVCLEHVRAPAATPEYRIQRFLHKPWRWLFEGCDLCRDTASVLRQTGFSDVRIEPFRLDTFVMPIAHQIEAVCVR